MTAKIGKVWINPLCHKLPGAPIAVAERNECKACFGDRRFPRDPGVLSESS